MSKSLNNYVGIGEPPEEMFGKLMSISDELMWRYFELLSFTPMAQIERWRREVEEGANPRDVKFRLGEEIVDRFHGPGAGKKAMDAFIARFQKGALPEEIPERTVACPEGRLALWAVLKEADLTPSTSEARRMIKQGAVRVDGERVEAMDLELSAGSSQVIQVGKRRFARVTMK